MEPVQRPTVAVFGLGCVGSVVAGCLARLGMTVVGVDVDAGKVEAVARGRSPIVEDGLEALLEAQVAAGRLSATQDVAAAVGASSMALVCVGTPSREDGALNLDHVRRCVASIGDALRERSGRYVVVLRSTMLPGAMREVVVPTLEERAGRPVGPGLGVAVNPEFLREGTAIRDFVEPPMTVVGAGDAETAAEVAALYAGVCGPVEIVPPGVAEMVKYADNAFHAMKVAFANEIGIIAKAEGMDGGEVMRVFCLDEKLNFSAAYLRPGVPFGGSCLPKDIRALTSHARQRHLRVPLLDALLASNAAHKRRALALIERTRETRIGFLGLAFKAGIDDVRESPVVDLVEQLVDKGHDVRVFDRSVRLGRLTGANRSFLLEHVPDIARRMVESVDALVAHADVIVIGNGDHAFADVGGLLRPGQRVIELERARVRPADGASMEGIAW